MHVFQPTQTYSRKKDRENKRPQRTEQNKKTR